jgi:hypothetical protein
LPPPNLPAKADRELENTDAIQFGEQKMAQLMNEDEDAKNQ